MSLLRFFSFHYICYTMKDPHFINHLKTGILSQNRAILAKAISLVESQKPEHKELALDLLNELLPYTGNSERIGISGTPGAGKSTFIEQLGLALIEKGRNVAVLAVDPSSTKTGGSILGDKTRMEQLSRAENAFIRPSPSRGYYGGIAISTYESALLCEAFGFDTILIETVGVGQSETMVADIVDMFLLIAISGGGDELQGIKRGIMEMADTIFINKVDEKPSTQDHYFYSDLKRALQLFPNPESGWKTPVIMGSALSNKGIDEIIHTIENYFETLKTNNAFQTKRRIQNIKRLERLLQQSVLDQYFGELKTKESYIKIIKQVESGELFALEAVRTLLQK